MGAVCCLMRYHFWASSESAGNGQLSSISSLRWILRRDVAESEEEDEDVEAVEVVVEEQEATVAEEGEKMCVEEPALWLLMGKHWPTASWIFCRRVRLLLLPLQLPLPTPPAFTASTSCVVGSSERDMPYDKACPDHTPPPTPRSLLLPKPGHLLRSLAGDDDPPSLDRIPPSCSPYSNPSLTGRSVTTPCEGRPFFLPRPPFRPAPDSLLSSERLCLTLGRAPRSLSFPLSPTSLGRDISK